MQSAALNRKAEFNDAPDFYTDMINEGAEQQNAKIEEEIANHLDNWTIPFIINQTSTNIKLDIGARANLINEADLKMWIQPRIEDNDCNLTDYHGAPIKTLGTCILQVEVNAQLFTVKISIVEADKRSLLFAVRTLQLVQRLYDTVTDVTDTDYITMADRAAIDAKSVETPEEESKTQATAPHTVNYKKGSTERVVDLEAAGALEHVKQCINTKSEVDRNKLFKVKPKAVSEDDPTASGGKCLLEKKHDGDVNGCSSNSEQKCHVRTTENKNERSEEHDKQEFVKHEKKSN
ncbi:hypothetical protein scyTo_0011061 [Scyliorhinus torazame]|uniref:Uncharacterized protein n=1 Tax=Scyliorhinus torazame TaxID=75743 RepID=A0A401NGK0_SCYTO|nr:hypothetical protein [Scyliorhinus torazame]